MHIGFLKISSFHLIYCKRQWGLLIVKKYQKLAFSGILTFAIVLFLILFSKGVFNRKLAESCPEGSCPYLFPDDSLIIQPLTIKNASITPNIIPVPKGKILALVVVNDDDKMHKLYELEKSGDEYRVLEKIYVKPNETRIIKGVFKGANIPFGREFNIVEAKPAGKGYPILNTSSSEVIISCPTCVGENSQVKIILEK
jgi:hypothetical protein